MKYRSLIGCILLFSLLVACGKGEAASTQPTAEPVSTERTAQAAAPQTPAQEAKQVVIPVFTSDATEIPAATMPPTPTPTPEPTPSPTPEPTPTPLPKLGVLDGKFADKFVTGAPVLTNSSYQTDKVAIFIHKKVDDSKTITRHTYNYFIADVYFQNMEDFKSAPAKSWEKIWTNDWLVNVAKKEGAIFAVSGDFTLTRKIGLVIRNGEKLQVKNDDNRDVGVIYKDGHMEVYLAHQTPVDEILNDPDVWQVLGFGPSLLDENGQPKTTFNDPNQVGHANIRNAVGYFEPGHYCFVYVPYYKTSDRYSCLDMQSLSQLMYQLGCVKAYNLDGGATAGMFFNGKLVTDRGLGQRRQIHDFYYIPR